MQKHTIWISITALCLSLIPQTVLASSCSTAGYTIEFVNGIFRTREQAQASATSLEYLVKDEYKGEPLTVRLAYNATHIAGAGDIAETISQILFAPLSEYDKNTMLREIASHATTRKLLVVGHSQGALYANSIYEYLTERGVPNRAIDVYALATPASYVAGGGKYGTFKNDMVINSVRYATNITDAPKPLPGNITGPGLLASLLDLTGAHALSSYVKYAPEQIKGDIYKTLDNLQADQNPEFAEGCIPAPPRSVVDAAQYIVFGIVDPVIHTAVHSVVATAQWGSNAAGTLVSSVGQILSNSKNNPAAPENEIKNFQVVKKLYGSSLDAESYVELNVPTNSKAIAVVSEPVVLTPELPRTATTTEPEHLAFVASTTTTQQIVMPRAGGSSIPSFSISSPVDNSNEPPDVFVSTTTTPGSSCVDDSLSCQQTTSSDPIATTTVPEPDPASLPPESAPSVPTPPPSLEPTALADTFDAFNAAGWVAISNPFGEHKLFDYIDGSDGSCISGGCVVGNDPALGYIEMSPIMAFMKGEPHTSGSFTLYAKATNGFNSSNPVLTICQSGFDACNDNGSMAGIHFFHAIPDDGMWHKYFVAWRQGADLVQKCILQDATDEGLCNWVNSEIPSGIMFNGIALWVANGFRNDLGTNVWFDELRGQ